MKNVTVVGAGATGLAASAYLTLIGHRVTLLEFYEYRENLGNLLDKPNIFLSGAGYDENVDIHAITTSPLEALPGADVIIIAMIANRHEKAAEKCLPYLHSDQTVLITPGNMGSLVFYKMSEHRDRLPLMAEIESNLHVVKRTGPEAVSLIIPVKPRYTAAFPSRRTAEVIEGCKDLYELLPARNVLETTLNLPNLDSHVPGMLLNAAKIERAGGSFYFYRDSLTPAGLRVIEALYAEKQKVMETFGLEVRTNLDLLYRIADPGNNPGFESFRQIRGPGTLSHRYLDEDAFAGITLLVSLARSTGVKTPTAEALLHLASILNRKDYCNQGRNLENLGLGGKSPEKMLLFLNDG